MSERQNNIENTGGSASNNTANAGVNGNVPGSSLQQLQNGSSTVTITETEPPAPILRLHQRRQKKTRQKPRVQWEEDVVDNEHMNKKKLKICCIFHPQREFGEFSDSSDSSDDSSSLGSEDERDSGRGRNHKCNHDHGDKDQHDHEHDAGDDHTHQPKRSPSPNAYEKQPVYPNQSTVPKGAI